MKATLTFFLLIIFGACSTPDESTNIDLDPTVITEHTGALIGTTPAHRPPFILGTLIDDSYSVRFELPVTDDHFNPFLRALSTRSGELGCGTIGNNPMPLIRLSFEPKPVLPHILKSGNIYKNQELQAQYEKEYAKYAEQLEDWEHDSTTKVNAFQRQLAKSLNKPKLDTLSNVYAMFNRAAIFLCEERPHLGPDVEKYLLIISDGKNAARWKTELDEVDCKFTTLIVNGEKNPEHQELAPNGISYFENISGAINLIVK